MKNIARLTAALAMSLFAALASAADAYPSHPIKLVVPYPPGGSIDMTARLLAKVITDETKETVIVDNRSGAAGIVGMDYVAKAPPDGYTLLMVPSGLTSNPWLYQKLPFDWQKSIAPISKIADQPNILVVNPNLGVKTVAELIAKAKANPGKLTYGSAGAGSTQHISAEVFQKMAGVKLLHVPYKGGAPGLLDVVAGQIDMQFETSPSVVTFIQAGKVVPLGVTTPKRITVLPKVPTIGETVKGYEAFAWIGFAAPAGTPPEILNKLNAIARKAVAGPLKQNLIELGLIPVGDSIPDFAKFLKEDYDTYGRVIKEAGIPPQ
jgi:tripartite-type tricarboxylate transporter receptor subunit TctC